VESPKTATSLAILEQEAARRRATGDFLSYYRALYPTYNLTAHVRYLAALFDRIANREENAQDRLYIALHPGSGKTELVCALASFLMARDPERRILLISSTESLAANNSRIARAHIEAPEFPFRGVQLGLSAETEWGIKGHPRGFVAAFGMDSKSIRGRRCDFVLLDDPQSDIIKPEEVDKLENTFRSVISTRLEPTPGVVIYTQQRLSIGDLPGRIVDGNWFKVEFKALAEKGDVLGRAIGEPLDPARFSAKMLKRKEFDVGPFNFRAQYQCDPQPEGGSVFVLADCPRYTPSTLPDRFDRIVCAYDTASKDLATSAFTARTTCGYVDGKVYVLDVHEARMKYEQIVADILSLGDSKFPIDSIIIEDKANGQTLLQDDRVLNNVFASVQGIEPHGDKVARAHRVSGMVVQHMVYLPNDPAEYPWQSAFLKQCADFPDSKFSDMVDSFVHALSVLKPESNSMAWTFDGKMEFSDVAAQARWDAFDKRESARENARTPQIEPEPEGETPEAFVERIGRMSESRFERELDKCNGHTGKKNRLVTAREAYIAAHAPKNRGFDMSDVMLDEPRQGVVLRGDKLHAAFQSADPFDALFDRPDVRAFYGES
jgi:predicted phage terminase large subunit-like protein